MTLINRDKEVNIEILEQLLSYDPETGILIWKERTLELCNSKRSMTRFNSVYAGKEAGSTLNAHPHRVNGYYKRQLAIKGNQFLAHRVAWALHHKQWPSDQIDHINGNAMDNRIKNLRVVSSIENNRNQCKQNVNISGFNGVDRLKEIQKWRAFINVEGKYIPLGYFVNIEDAVAARAAADIKYGFHKNHGREALTDGH